MSLHMSLSNSIKLFGLVEDKVIVLLKSALMQLYMNEEHKTSYCLVITVFATTNKALLLKLVLEVFLTSWQKGKTGKVG